MKNEQLINETLQSLGISKCYKGYKQLLLSVELALDDESRLMCITANIYHQVAELCCCRYCQVERNIRTVSQRIWTVNPQKLVEIAGYSLDSSPTVSELISILVTYVERNSTDS